MIMTRRTRRKKQKKEKEKDKGKGNKEEEKQTPAEKLWKWLLFVVWWMGQIEAQRMNLSRS